MSARRVIAILLKDLRDAGRDGRIVVLLVLPIALAVLYNATVDDGDTLPSVDVAVVQSGPGTVAKQLRLSAGKSVELELRRAADATAARRLVAHGDVELAVVVAPPAATGEGPARADVLVSTDASPTAQSVVALVPDALTRAAGREPTAQTQLRAVAPADQDPPDIVGAKALSVLLMIVLLAAFVAMMVVPIQTAEELETGTFGALRLAATGPEILAAKALAGYLYGAAGIVVTLLLTQLHVDDPVLFFGAAVALIVSLVGFGLLLGLLVPNANAINTFGGVLLLPVIALAGAVYFVDSGVIATICSLLPFSQAARLLGNGLSARDPFDAGLSAWAVIAVWAVAGYAILARIATRREL
jgi:hypothetical protein